MGRQSGLKGAAGLGACHVAVCVPARNEAALLPRLIAALREQRLPHGIAAGLCLFLDGCVDGSAAVARAHAQGLAIVIEEGGRHPEPNAGRARRAAMQLGIAMGADHLLTTDADSVPAPDWIERAIAALRMADVVAGRILRERAEADPAHGRLERYYDRLYAYRRAVDPVAWEAGGGHHYTGGANLGFRADAYVALGGFPALPAGEDAALVDEAARAGLRVRRDPHVVVQTSDRRDGRAIGGLATALHDLDGRGTAPLRVGAPSAAAWQYARHAHARACFARLPDRGTASDLGRAIALDADHVIGVARDCPNAEAFAMRIVPAAPDADALVPLAEAERALDRMEQALLERAA